jgi:large subunit ribosomal protein L25
MSMKELELRAETRTLFGRNAKKLRREGLIPATLYGPKTKAVSLQLPERELMTVLDEAGTNRLIALFVDDGNKARRILARDVQRDVVSQSLLHVDLYEVVMTEKITAEIPIALIGESPGVAKKEGLLVRGLDSIEVHCLPDRLGETIEVDISVLEEKDQAILVQDLVVGEGIEILTHPEEVVVQLLPLREVVIEPLVEEEVEVAEVEIITTPKEREERPEEPLRDLAEPESDEQETQTEE